MTEIQATVMLWLMGGLLGAFLVGLMQVTKSLWWTRQEILKLQRMMELNSRLTRMTPPSETSSPQDESEQPKLFP